MKVRFFGPLGRVTGSCAMLWDDALGFRALVDCGMEQGEGDERWNVQPFPFDPRSIDLVLLTHAHVDHSGLLPKLVREGFCGRVISTPETAALARALLLDAARIERRFTPEDVQSIRFEPTRKPFGHRFSIGRGVHAHLYRTAHILGAVAIRVSWDTAEGERSIVFSGDVGTHVAGAERGVLLRHVMTPDPSTYAVIESTYGGAVRPLRTEESYLGRVEALRSELVRAIARGGTVLIPTFAADRLPAVLVDLARVCAIDGRVAETPIYVHRGLAAKCAQIYAESIAAKDLVRERAYPRWISRAAYVHLGLDANDPAHERALEEAVRAILDPRSEAPSPVAALRRVHRWIDVPARGPGPKIVLAAGGMCEGGAVVAYLADVATDPTSTILMTGYVTPQSVGGRLLRVAELPARERMRLGTEIVLRDRAATRIPEANVRATIRRLQGYSAHADQRGLLDWLFYERDGELRRAGSTVFLQHGTETSRHRLAAAIRARDPSVEIVLPMPSTAEHDLDARPPPVAESDLRSTLEDLQVRLAELERTVARRASLRSRRVRRPLLMKRRALRARAR